MNRIFPYREFVPKIHPSVFIADGAKIIGDVEILQDSSIWFNVVIRGDINFIRIGRCTNIQDNSVLHVTSQTAPLYIGSYVTVGHNAILHGCTVEDYCLVGMGAVVLDKAIVKKRSMVGAGSLVLQNSVIPEGTLVAGVPAKVIRDLTDSEIKSIEESAIGYLKYSKVYRERT